MQPRLQIADTKCLIHEALEDLVSTQVWASGELGGSPASPDAELEAGVGPQRAPTWGLYKVTKEPLGEDRTAEETWLDSNADQAWRSTHGEQRQAKAREQGRQGRHQGRLTSGRPAAAAASLPGPRSLSTGPPGPVPHSRTQQQRALGTLLQGQPAELRVRRLPSPAKLRPPRTPQRGREPTRLRGLTGVPQARAAWRPPGPGGRPAESPDPTRLFKAAARVVRASLRILSHTRQPMRGRPSAGGCRPQPPATKQSDPRHRRTEAASPARGLGPRARRGGGPGRSPPARPRVPGSARPAQRRPGSLGSHPPWSWRSRRASGWSRAWGHALGAHQETG